MSPSIDILT